MKKKTEIKTVDSYEDVFIKNTVHMHMPKAKYKHKRQIICQHIISAIHTSAKCTLSLHAHTRTL